MQVTETAAAGLKREYRVVVPATDLEAKVNERLDDLKGRVQLRGFRPGKVPVAHLKRLYGKSAMAEVIEAAVREANTKIVADHGFKLATEPKVVLPSEEGAVEGVIDGKSDLAYTVEMEIVPPITLADFKAIKLDAADRRRSTMPRSTSAGDDRASRTGRSWPRRKAREKGDRVTISFQGTMNGEAFEGGSGEDVPIMLGSGQFIPGLRRPPCGHQGRRKPDLRRQVSRRLSGARRGRQRGDLCGHRKDGRGARRRHHGRRLCQDARARIARQAARRAARAHRARARRRLAAEDQARAARSARCWPQIRAAADAGRAGVQ